MPTQHISSTDLLSMEQRYRAAFINSLGGFKSLCMIGTKNKAQHTNLAIFNSIVHIGANPALIGFIVRPDSVERHTLENILETNYYTINHLNETNYKQAHQTSARYARETSEFEACGLTEEYLNQFHAPYVKESQIKLGLELKNKVDLTINGTILIIGQVVDIYIPENSIEKDGFVNIEKCGTITGSGLDAYYHTKKIARLAYAKPNIAPIVI
jgi:flavin reductase (DIM6/NTAB) family NADH-FMN oxidoreductase RutF